ncbi:protein kinase domain-containing protein [Nitrosomonas supralitoralis]|uniref:non-specific serine/threonine protein kinase n=1 Tax=Nitrosomonas supralitoralis TaxID=2116706 RepID=A0A2P7NZ38_9PROT|nr:protein kinase [Nitrosomonas supralitoralis]PSJ18729.1 serine/threonine protein kinase [Nitrosomonas supralitoralis]
MTHIHDQILPEGTHIGVYEIKGVAKVGSFDITYRALNHHLKERVKIREYFPHDFAIRSMDGLGVEPRSLADKENYDYGLKAFLDQAEVLTQIEHPNIAVTENILSLNGTAYLIMGAQEGMPLSKLLEAKASLAETELKFILTSVLNALQKIHEHKIVHGGIQPAVILIGKDGEPLLINFAAARLAIAARTPRFAEELATGYAPAEQYESGNKPGPATDFYALGAVLYACMTHHSPVAAQIRRATLSQGEPDPMNALSRSADTAYSAELLQAVQWMLQPEYQDRPQSAGEILTLLKSEHTSESKTSSEKQAVADSVAHGRPVANNRLLMGVMVGIVVLVTVGLWFDENPNDGSGTVATEPLFQRNPGKAIDTPETKDDSSVTSVATEASPESVSEKISETMQEVLSEAENQSTESMSLPENLSIVEPERNTREIAEPVSDNVQPLAMADVSPSQSTQQSSSVKPIDSGLIKKHLTAAEKSMIAERLTTPSRDNAYKYYQMVLAIEPDNAEALAGLQRIVGRYIQFIEKSKAEGKFDAVKLYLQRAESVLPDDPNLQKIRAELASAQ